MKRHWHILAILLTLVIGVVAIFWPAPSEKPASVSLPARGPELRDSGGTPAPDGPAVTEQPVAASSPSEFTQQAMNARAIGDIESAMLLFEQAISVDPTDTAALSNYGRLLTLTLSLERAIEVLEAARDLQPSDAQAWLDLATAYERAQRFSDSRRAQAEAQSLVGAEAITRDEQGRFVVAGTTLE